MAFGLDGVIYAALLTLAALAPRAVAPCLHLVFKLSTFRAFLPCRYRLFSHIPYYSIIALVWTLPRGEGASNRAVKGSQKGKRGQKSLDVWNDSGAFETRSGYRPVRKQLRQLEDFPAFAENTCCGVPE